MEGNLENAKKQVLPGIRSKQEIIASIRTKLANKEPLDPEELAEFERQREENEKEDKIH